MRTCGGKNENIVINVLTWLFAYQTRAFCERWAWDKLPDSNSRQVGLCLTISGPVYTAGKSLRRDGSRIHCGWNAHDKFRVEYVSLNTGINTQSTLQIAFMCAWMQFRYHIIPHQRQLDARRRQWALCTGILFWLPLVPITIITFNTECQIVLYLAAIFAAGRSWLMLRCSWNMPVHKWPET